MPSAKPIISPSSTTREPERRRVSLSSLIASEEQDLAYDACSETEDAAFVDDIRRRGLDRPIETFPPANHHGEETFEILDGNRRMHALKVEGAIETEIIIRWDLHDASAEDRHIAFLSANFQRRQLDAVQKVRVAIRLYEWKHNRGRRLLSYQLQKAREQIGKLIGVSGRTVSRYLRLARSPLAVQRAVSRGLLRLTIGEKVADLDADQQKEIAERISSVDDASQVYSIVGEYLGTHDGRHVGVADAMASFAKALARGEHDLHGRLEKVSPRIIEHHLPTLEASLKTIKLLVAKARKS